MSADLVPVADLAEIRQALAELDGNVSKAAERFGMAPERLRAIVRAEATLAEAIEEAMEQGVDLAVNILYEGLRDQGSFQNRFYAAKEFLRSEAGRRRGFGPREPAQATLEVRAGAGSPVITLRWLEPPAEAELLSKFEGPPEEDR